jgi:hypothetical protein
MRERVSAHRGAALARRFKKKWGKDLMSLLIPEAKT